MRQVRGGWRDDQAEVENAIILTRQERCAWHPPGRFSGRTPNPEVGRRDADLWGLTRPDVLERRLHFR